MRKKRLLPPGRRQLSLLEKLGWSPPSMHFFLAVLRQMQIHSLGPQCGKFTPACRKFVEILGMDQNLTAQEPTSWILCQCVFFNTSKRQMVAFRAYEKYLRPSQCGSRQVNDTGDHVGQTAKTSLQNYGLNSFSLRPVRETAATYLYNHGILCGRIDRV